MIDDHGILHFHHRSDDLLNVKGYLINPHDVEKRFMTWKASRKPKPWWMMKPFGVGVKYPSFHDPSPSQTKNRPSLK
jgi:hypothetical protein